MTVREFRFRILGPIAVECGGERVDLGGYRQQALLTVLVLESGRVVPIDQLIDAIWGQSPPASARNQVRICVSKLRGQFAAMGGRDIIETHPVGYRMRVPRGAIDHHRFEDFAADGRGMATAGRLQDASGLLAAALGLWVGPIGAGLDSAVIQAAAHRLHEDRLSVLEDYVDLQLSLGRQRHVIGELTGHVAEHPFREKLCAQLMVALHRSGRQADALELFRRTRRRFSDELGIEPGESLRELEHRILSDDPDLRDPGLSLAATAVERRTEDRLDVLERENARLRAEHDLLKRAFTCMLGDRVDELSA